MEKAYWLFTKVSALIDTQTDLFENEETPEAMHSFVKRERDYFCPDIAFPLVLTVAINQNPSSTRVL